MARACFILKVKADRLAEYKQRHEHVWPDMLQALRDTGWRNYSLFLRDDGLLIGYVECDDFQTCLAGMAGKEVNKRWQDQMAPFFEGIGGTHADRAMILERGQIVHRGTGVETDHASLRERYLGTPA